jgi:hypothetical protein
VLLAVSLAALLVDRHSDAQTPQSATKGVLGAAAKAPEIPAWEYKTISLELELERVNAGTNTALSKLGAEGWELVLGVESSQKNFGPYFVLKRPLIK